MRALAFCCLLFPLLLHAASQDPNWKSGRVTADSSISANQYMPTAQHSAIDPHIVIIQGDDSIYTVREKHAWTGWCLLIQGETIKYAQDGQRLSIVDADGQKCQFDILIQQKRPSP